jgi:hypothetical protein
MCLKVKCPFIGSGWLESSGNGGWAAGGRLGRVKNEVACVKGRDEVRKRKKPDLKNEVGQGRGARLRFRLVASA